MAGLVGISDEAQMKRKERLGAFWDGWTAMRLTGLRSATDTGWGQWTETKRVDIAAKAKDFDDPGENPYNNWLNGQGQPAYNVYPRFIGFYMGEGFPSKNAADNQDVKRILIEHATLTVKTSGGNIWLNEQPLISLSPGLGLLTFSTDAFVYTEQFGPLAPQGMYRLPEETAFSTKDTPQIILKINPQAQAELVSQAGSFPDPGCILGVRLLGEAAYNRNAGRG